MSLDEAPDIGKQRRSRVVCPRLDNLDILIGLARFAQAGKQGGLVLACTTPNARILPHQQVAHLVLVGFPSLLLLRFLKLL